MRTDEDPVVVEERYSASSDAVWRAITSIDEMRQWYFENIPAFEPEAGFETEFLVINEGREFPHCWKVTEVMPPGKITYEWTFRGYPGRGLVTFELFPSAGETTLKLTNSVLEDFPDSVPEFRRESCVAGWEYFLGQSLKGYLEKTT